MLQVEEAQSGTQMEFPLAVLEGLRPPVEQANDELPVTERALRPYEISLSGSQVLLGSATALGSIGPLVWALVKLWLFGH